MKPLHKISTLERLRSNKFIRVLEDIGSHKKSSNEPTKSKYGGPGWRSTIRVWIYVTTAVMVANIVVLIWAKVKPNLSTAPAYNGPTTSDYTTQGNDTDSVMLFQGSCQTANRIKQGTHLAINIASTILLMASSNCMQCLSAPTREELDRSHAESKYLEIGILSARNLRFIPLKRSLLWFLLAISSMPLHFLYNSIIFFSTSSNQLLTYVVSTEFASASSLNTTFFDTLSSSFETYVGFDVLDDVESTARILFERSAASNQSVKYFDTDTCMATFNLDILKGYRSVALITSVSNSSQIFDCDVMDFLGQPAWTCYNASATYSSTEELLSSCREEQMVGRLESSGDSISGDVTFPDRNSILTGCLAETALDECSIQLAPSLLGLIIAANAVKVFVMLYTVGFVNFEPIVTAGDALRTFLERPDCITVGMGAVSQRDIKTSWPCGPSPSYACNLSYTHTLSHRASELLDPQIQVQTFTLQSKLNSSQSSTEMLSSRCPRSYLPWAEGSRRWIATVSTWRWIISIGLCLILEAIAGHYLHSSTADTGGTLRDSIDIGFGSIDPLFSDPNPFSSTSILTIAALSNLPQVLISTVYVLYYALISAMVFNAELSGYANRRRPLRVSPPQRGLQQSSYWLTLPWRIGLPLIVATTVLHWMVSQSLFMLRIDFVLVNGKVVYGAQEGLGFSPIAIVTTMAWGGVMIAAPLILGLIKLPKGFPIIGHNSIAIAAACHTDPMDSSDMIERSLMYGVLPTPIPPHQPGDGDATSDTASEVSNVVIRCVGFSSLPVEPLVEGEIYSTYREQETPTFGVTYRERAKIMRVYRHLSSLSSYGQQC